MIVFGLLKNREAFNTESVNAFSLNIFPLCVTHPLILYMSKQRWGEDFGDKFLCDSDSVLDTFHPGKLTGPLMIASVVFFIVAIVNQYNGGIMYSILLGDNDYNVLLDILRSLVHSL